MSLLLAWNELSETPQAASKAMALGRMNLFVDTFAAIRSRTTKYVSRPTLRCRATLDGVELSPDYRVANWRVDTDQVRRMLFLSVVTASPFLPKLEEGGSADQHGSEATCSGRRAEGLHSAWVWDGVGLSLASDACWDVAHVPLEIDQIADSGDVERTSATVRHASTPDHVREHEPWLEEQARLTIGDASDLWRRRSELFPHLEFCREVEQEMLKLDSGSPHLRQTVLRLFDLERAFSAWDKTPLHPDFLPSKCTPETPQTLNEEAADHTATRVSGEERLFSWHVRFTPDAGRIFFDGDPDSGRGVIGYVGLKKGGKLS